MNMYATYNGLNRPAMYMGVPLILLLSTGFLAVFGGFGAIFLWGFAGLFLPGMAGLFLFFVRMLCESDPNALRVIRLVAEGVILKIKHQDKIVGYD